MTIFKDCIDHLLAGEIDEAETDCNNINFELIKIDDTGIDGEDIYCLKEVTLKGQGFLCINYNSAKKHHVSAPHPKHDSDTDREAVEVMRGIGARYLSIATTHRCENTATSSCDGTTTACGSSSAFRVSDMAHNADSYLHNFGVKVNDYDSSIITIQLHGCGTTFCQTTLSSDDVVARFSVGTTNNNGSNELVNRLEGEMNTLLSSYSEGDARSCSDENAADDDDKLCATTNPLGRYINGSTSNPCDDPAWPFTDFKNSRFLHIEQNWNLRHDNDTNTSSLNVTPAMLISALNSTLQGFAISSISGNTTEAGGTATFTVKLDSEQVV